MLLDQTTQQVHTNCLAALVMGPLQLLETTKPSGPCPAMVICKLFRQSEITDYISAAPCISANEKWDQGASQHSGGNGRSTSFTNATGPRPLNSDI